MHQIKKPSFTPNFLKFKHKRKTIFAPYYDNILNHDTNEYILKYLFHVQYIMPYIMIKITKDIAKLVMLMVEGIT